MMRGLLAVSLAIVTAYSMPAAAAPPARRADGASIVRALGPRALDAFAPPGAPGLGALVRLPPGVRAGDWGLKEVAPGIGRIWGQPSNLVAFADAHPSGVIEVAPPLRVMLDSAAGFVGATEAIAQGLDGSGVLVGVADTGLDVTHGDFLDPQGHTRVAWLLDLSAPPRGVHADLESQFGSTDSSGRLLFGAVWSGAEIDQLLAAGGSSTLPQDPAGHGTLVTACAAGNGNGGRSKYRGIAPAAGLVIARITDSSEENIGNDELLRGVAFIVNRADALAQPVVINLSIGTDFGPHDGTMAWEQTLASYVGPTHPGRAIVVAAGNSGSIADLPIHQNVRVSAGTRARVPIVTQGALSKGGVQVWVAVHGGASLSVGLDKPDGTWIEPVAPGQSAGSSDQKAGVYNGSQPTGSLVPAQSNGAVVVWQGAWPAGTYYVTLTGTGTADLYLQATGDAAIPGVTQVTFADGVREGTIGLPATHPALIGVGCTINKASWTDFRGVHIGVPVPVLDAFGGEVDPGGASRQATVGEPCWFSGAGPTLTGVLKPDIMAPGAAIVGAMSKQAVPPSMTSIFSSPSCPDGDATCQQIDSTHAVALGTSFSSPIVAGTVAVMLQQDRLLTQDWILAALQGGAHPLRAPALFADQGGPGEVDVRGALAVAARLRHPETVLPVRAESWMVLGGDHFIADGSTPLEGLVELRAQPVGTSAPGPADGFDPSRLAAYALVDGVAVDGAVSVPVRRGPGIWVVAAQAVAGLGGSRLTLGVKFDGVDVVDPRSVPIATDEWNAGYPPSIKGGCAAGGAGGAPGSWLVGCGGLTALLLERRRADRGKARRLGARGLARAVERQLEEHGPHHLVDSRRRDGERSEGRADARELAGDDAREPQREPGLRNQSGPPPATDERIVVRDPARDAGPYPCDDRPRARQEERHGPELSEQGDVEIGACGREEDDVDHGPRLLDRVQELSPLLGHVADDEPRDHEREERVELQVVEDRAHAEAEDEQHDQHLPIDQAQVRRDDRAPASCRARRCRRARGRASRTSPARSCSPGR